MPDSVPPITKNRPHRPYELGPAVFQRGRWYAADLRPWGGGRPTLRDPNAIGWPARGDATEDADVAERWKWEYVAALRGERRRRHLGLPPKPKPVGERVEAFLLHRARVELAPNTVRADRAALEVHLLGTVGRALTVDRIDVPKLQDIADALLVRGYRASSVQRIVHSFGAFFEWCGFADTENPARAVVLPDRVRADAVAWSDEDVDRLRAAADELDATPWNGWFSPPASMRRTLEFGLATGGRKLELAAAREGWFSYADRTIRFSEQLTPDGQDTRILKGKLGRTTLVLPSWWDFHIPLARKDARVLAWHGDLVPDASTIHLWMQRLYDAAGLNAPGLGWHTLRHTYSRIFLEAGGRLEELQKSLGHTSIVTTEQTYEHFHENVAALLARQRIYRDNVQPRAVRAEHTARRA